MHSFRLAGRHGTPRALKIRHSTRTFAVRSDTTGKRGTLVLMKPIDAAGRILATGAAALVLAAGAAFAEEKSGDWDITIGAGPGLQPRFESGREYRATVVPYLDITWRDLLFLSTEDGLGANLLREDGLTAGPFLQLSNSRRERDAQRLQGLGDVNTVVQGGAFMSYEWARDQDVFFKLRRDIGGDRSGTFADLGADFTMTFTEQWIGTLRVMTTWATAEALQPFFGVTPAQSAASGEPLFSTHSGFKDLTIEPTLTRILDSHWSLMLRTQYERLLPAVTKSPLVRNGGTADQFEVGLLLNYHF
jgi:outer membrane scaffolding protein for murein synthesis (MipA/OmpV family)